MSIFDEASRKANPILALAYDNLKDAQRTFQEELRSAFPSGRKVMITHHRGQFEGVVDRTENHGDSNRVRVINVVTGKTSWVYAMSDVNGQPCIKLLEDA